MVNDSYIILGVIVAISITIISYFIYKGFNRWRGYSSGKDGFSLATPATPRVLDGVNGLFLALRDMADLGPQFEAECKSIDATPGKMPASIAAARASVAQVTGVVKRVEAQLSGTPPTYANYVAIYRGLSSSDASLLRAADSYIAAGRDANQSMALDPPGTPNGDIAGAGNILMAMGRTLRKIVANVHRLGVALDVE